MLGKKKRKGFSMKRRTDIAVEGKDFKDDVRNAVGIFLKGELLVGALKDIEAGQVTEVRDGILEIITCRYHNGIMSLVAAQRAFVALRVDPQDLKSRTPFTQRGH